MRLLNKLVNKHKRLNVYMHVIIFQDSIKYSITGEASAPQFFYVDPDTGIITVKKLLSEGDTSQYTVSVAQSMDRLTLKIWENFGESCVNLRVKS